MACIVITNYLKEKIDLRLGPWTDDGNLLCHISRGGNICLSSNCKEKRHRPAHGFLRRPGRSRGSCLGPPTVPRVFVSLFRSVYGRFCPQTKSSASSDQRGAPCYIASRGTAEEGPLRGGRSAFCICKAFAWRGWRSSARVKNYCYVCTGVVCKSGRGHWLRDLLS